jgi:hypothetical protein
MANLPGWVVDNREAVAREAAPYRGLSARDRFLLLASACRTAAHQLANRPGPERERILAWRDPVPASTQEILERLREQDRNER